MKNLRDRWNDLATKTMMGGMAALLLFSVWPRFLHVGTNLNPDWIDGLRGFLIGLSIGLNLMAVILNSRRRLGC